MNNNSYQNLKVWQKSMHLARDIYNLTGNFPNNEKYGISSQMQRAAVGIPSNIAEGQMRRSRKEFLQFIYIALGSTAELETQLLICQSIDRLPSGSTLLSDVDEIKKMLFALANKIESTANNKR